MEPIKISEPFLPPLEEFIPYLEDIWKRRWLTNNGHYHQALEQALCEFLKVPYISLFNNGTLALVTAIQTLKLAGEVITTPFSFVATTHALWWNKITPVFADIEWEYCNINPQKIESLITPRTTGILGVHVYGNPCEINAINKIACKYGLRVIYDAAHAFGVNYKGKSILEFGDLSILSFHATKIYNTFEGGAIICHDRKTKKRIDLLKNFGFVDELTIIEPGLNAKMNEFQAALGLLQLKYFEMGNEQRKSIADTYRKAFTNLDGISFMADKDQVKHNYSYFPIFIDEQICGKNRDQLYFYLKQNKIFGRRYFYPLISDIPLYRLLPSANLDNLAVAKKRAEQVLCLPINTNLSSESINYIIEKVCKYVK